MENEEPLSSKADPGQTPVVQTVNPHTSAVRRPINLELHNW